MSSGDVVFFGDDAGQVLMCACDEDTLMVIAEKLNHVAAVSAHSAKYAGAGHQVVWKASLIEQSLAWYTCADGCTVVIRM